MYILLDSMHQAVSGCETIMAVSETYLAAKVNAAAVAKHDGVKRFINTSQMTLAQMTLRPQEPSQRPRTPARRSKTHRGI